MSQNSKWKIESNQLVFFLSEQITGNLETIWESVFPGISYLIKTPAGAPNIKNYPGDFISSALGGDAIVALGMQANRLDLWLNDRRGISLNDQSNSSTNSSKFSDLSDISNTLDFLKDLSISLSKVIENTGVNWIGNIINLQEEFPDMNLAVSEYEQFSNTIFPQNLQNISKKDINWLQNSYGYLYQQGDITLRKGVTFTVKKLMISTPTNVSTTGFQLHTTETNVLEQRVEITTSPLATDKIMDNDTLQKCLKTILSIEEIKHK